MQTRFNMHPMLGLFLKLTAAITIAIVVLWILSKLVMIAIVAAAIAAVLLGGFFLYNLFRRRPKLPISR
jgi:hypothetical protein